MKITVLGAGNIGGTLAKKWLAAGHDVIFGVRDSQSAKTMLALEKAGGSIRAVSVQDALRFGQVILISIPWGAVPGLLAEHAPGLADKIVLDATNNFAGPVISNLGLIQEKAPSALLYRAFNSLGWEIFANPLIGPTQVDMFYTGPDGPHRPEVDRLIAEVGVRPVWLGDNDKAVVVDALGQLWVTLVFQRGMPRRIALKLVE